MRFACQLTQHPSGMWSLRHVGADMGTVEVTAASKEEALAKMRDELRYRLELCPCSGDSYQHIPIEIVQDSTDKVSASGPLSSDAATRRRR